MLLRECDAGGVTALATVRGAGGARSRQAASSSTPLAATVRSAQLVVATGGLSIPKIGATDFGYRLARQFGHRIVETRPALVPLTFDAVDWAPFGALSGLSLPVDIATGAGKAAGRFLEDLLFTHRGLSGPAVLQISSFWQPGTPLRIDLRAGHRPGAASGARQARFAAPARRTCSAELLPRRLADIWLAATPELATAAARTARPRPAPNSPRRLQHWALTPVGHRGLSQGRGHGRRRRHPRAESQTMQSRRVPGCTSSAKWST